MEDRVSLAKGLSQGIGEGDLNLAFYSACASLGVRNYFVEARFQDFASLKADLRVEGDKVIVRVSDGFKAASEDAVKGLALHLVSRAFRKRLPEESKLFLKAYKQFTSSKASAQLSDSLRRLRGHKELGNAEGVNFDLNAELQKLVADYPAFFAGLALPIVCWSKERSRRRLGFYDRARHRIVISSIFDSPKVPVFVLRYLLFHEFLHARHEVLYERGQSLRRTVHTSDFKNDERQFAQYAEAEDWITSSLRFLR